MRLAFAVLCLLYQRRIKCIYDVNVIAILRVLKYIIVIGLNKKTVIKHSS